MSQLGGIALPPRPSLASRLSGVAQALSRSVSTPPKYAYSPGNNDNTKQTGLLQDLQALGFQDAQTMVMFLNTTATGVDDDNDLLLERMIQMLSKLPPHSHEGKQMTDGLINQLWSGLEHPPKSSLGKEYRYREPDGSCNNIRDPQLGAANTPYARSMPPMVFQSPDLPGPESLFDLLMARGDDFEPHPNGISSMLFYLAAIITHDIFQTDSKDFNINTTSSYLDLSPLYGRNLEEQRIMRTFKDGLLKPDCFSSKRLLGLPPGCGVFLIMFNRFHNYTASQLASINEGGQFTKPGSYATGMKAESAWLKYDNDLFQTARLITCGLYVNIVMKDYVRTILALNRTDSVWGLDPRTKEGKNMFSNPAPEATGSQVSVEFNLIYRWHSALSQKDENWTEKEFKNLLGGKDPATAPMHEVLAAMGRWESMLPEWPEARPFAGLARNADGTYDDESLVKMLQESIQDIAGTFGANKIPNCLRTVEILGIIQARHWNVATLNEFRTHFGLTKHETFEDINPDPEVAMKLMQLYDSPDSVELYPGLIAEKPKPPMSPGSGLCVNFTTSRAILSDAVALVRGDRFYTIDYTPKNLTNWGYNEVDSDVKVNQGQVMHKLIFRAFPNHFRQNSIYAHFPFVTPSENFVILDKLGTSTQYSWASPSKRGHVVVIESYKAVTQILENKKDFRITGGEAIEFETAQPDGSYARDFCLGGDEEANSASRIHVRKALYASGWFKEISTYNLEITQLLLESNSFKIGPRTREVDIIRDVIGLANTRFVSALYNLPLKNKENPHGIYTEQEMYMVLLTAFSAIFFDADIAQSFKLRNIARELAQQLGQLVMANAEVVSKTSYVSGFFSRFSKPIKPSTKPSLLSYGNHMIRRLLEKGKSVEESVWGTIMPMTATVVATQTQTMSQCLDYYLEDGKEHLPQLYRLAHLGTKEADELLMRYMLEGCRLRGTVAIYRDLATDQTIADYHPHSPPSDSSNPNPQPTTKTHVLKSGTRLLLNLSTASRDPTIFPSSSTVRLDRPLDSYIHYGWGPHQCLGMEASRAALTAMFKSIVGLKGLRRAPGSRGRVKSMPARVWNGQVGNGQVGNGQVGNGQVGNGQVGNGQVGNGQVGNVVVGSGHEREDRDGELEGLRVYMTADQSSYWPLPSTMKVRWDA
ncbi:related to Linoleate diol synthase [Phialocephala subalpina]|uniref:Related to Linoleate diol synthase n=1 Tax=Phialocephala subalpina TaxID=576137 RepID=A0A1L7XJV9_9HELO|nr:related to Linoleate diol synthase [Phialocephala subalpina]